MVHGTALGPAPHGTAPHGTAESCQSAPAEPGLPGNTKADFGVRELKTELEEPLCPQHKAQPGAAFAFWLLRC